MGLESDGDCRASIAGQLLASHHVERVAGSEVVGGPFNAINIMGVRGLDLLERKPVFSVVAGFGNGFNGTGVKVHSLGKADHDDGVGDGVGIGPHAPGCHLLFDFYCVVREEGRAGDIVEVA